MYNIVVSAFSRLSYNFSKLHILYDQCAMLLCIYNTYIYIFMHKPIHLQKHIPSSVVHHDDARVGWELKPLGTLGDRLRAPLNPSVHWGTT